MLTSPDDGVPILRTRKARYRRLIMPLVVLLVVALIAFLMIGSGGQSEIIGSGSTLAQPLIESSAGAYRDAANADNPLRPGQTGGDWVLDGSGIDYEAVGSLGGILRLDDPEVDFAVSDYPVSAATLSELDVAQFPIAVGSIAVVHNLELPAGQVLRLDAPTLAAIYLGRITRWNDTALAALNPEVTLPDQPINAVHRSDGSGTTFGLSAYLTAGSPEWADGPGTGPLLTWPGGGQAAARSSGLVTAVKATPGSLGYVEHGRAVREGLHPIRLRNAAGEFTTSDATTMGAALTEMSWSGEDDYVDPLPVSTEAGAYPMTVAIYALVKREPRFKRDTTATLQYLSFLIEHYDATTAELGYLPLPADAAQAVRDYWSKTLNYTARALERHSYGS